MFKYLMFSIFLLTKYNTSGFPQKKEVSLLRNENENKGNGNHNVFYELSDGTRVESHGRLDEHNYNNVHGSYQFKDKDKIHFVSYVADKNGYQPKVKYPFTPTIDYEDIFQYETNTLNPFLRTIAPIDLDSRILGIIVKSPTGRK